jgi:hypothetical protein
MHVRYFLTVPRVDGPGRYITGELAADPDYEDSALSLKRPALWNIWVDDDVPRDDEVVRYRREELLLEDWGPAALHAWEMRNDSEHDRTCWDNIRGMVHRELINKAKLGDQRAIELLSPGHSFKERMHHAWS